MAGRTLVTKFLPAYTSNYTKEFRQKGWAITKEKYGQYIQELCRFCKKRLDAAGINPYNKNIEKEISPYAYRAYLQGRFDEVEAEWRSRKALNILGQANQNITTEGTNNFTRNDRTVYNRFSFTR